MADEPQPETSGSRARPPRGPIIATATPAAPEPDDRAPWFQRLIRTLEAKFGITSEPHGR